MPYWFDGNNLIGLSAAAAHRDRCTRVEFLSTLSGYRKAGGGRILVWFDGDDPADILLPPGVNVCYSAPESADAAICRRLREIEHPLEVVVVTNDRELASRCRNAGAATLDWRQFTMKIQAHAAVPPRPFRVSPSRSTDTSHRSVPVPSEKSDAPSVDVDDWMHFFGLDKTKS